jgi:hypothetical protein
VLTAADRGHPVPMLVGGPLPRHYVLVVGYRAGDVLLYEPTGRDTLLVAERDFLNGTLRQTAGFDHVQAVVVPTWDIRWPAAAGCWGRSTRPAPARTPRPHRAR